MGTKREIEPGIPFQSFREYMMEGAIVHVPLQKLHSAATAKWEEGGWTKKPSDAAAAILLASMKKSHLRQAVEDKLFTPNKKGDFRLDRVADIYTTAVKNAKDAPDDIKKHLADSVSKLPFDQLPVTQALQLLRTLQTTYGEDIPEISFRYNPLEILPKALSTNLETANPELLGTVLSTHRWYETEQQGEDVLRTLADWATNPQGGAKPIRVGYGSRVSMVDMFLGEILLGLADRPQLQAELIQSFWAKGISLTYLPGYIGEAFSLGWPDAERLYQLVEKEKPDSFSGEFQAQTANDRARWLIKDGNLDGALAEISHADYEYACYILINVAKAKASKGDIKEARELLRAVYKKPEYVEANGSQTDIALMPEVNYEKRGFILESLAEAALSLGDIPLAIEAYDHSSKHPMRTEINMAKIALKEGLVKDYVKHLATDSTTRLFSRTILAIESLRVAQRQWGMDQDKQNDLNELTQLVEPLVQELTLEAHKTQYPASRSDLLKDVATIFSLTGRVEDALALVDSTKEGSYGNSRIVREAIFAKSYAGDCKSAWELFRTNPDVPTDSLSIEEILRELLRSAVLTKNFPIASWVLRSMQEHHVHKEILGIYKEYGDILNANELPDWFKAPLLFPVGSSGEVNLFECADLCSTT